LFVFDSLLRLAYYVSQLGFDGFLDLLIGDDTDYQPYLAVYESVTTVEPRPVRDYYEKRSLRNDPAFDTEPGRLGLFHPAHYVWSDEFAFAVAKYQFEVLRDEEADPKKGELLFPGQLLQVLRLVMEGLDLTTLAPPEDGARLTAREIKKKKKADRDKRWRAYFVREKLNHPEKSREDIAKDIAKLPIAEDAESSTILRCLGRNP
jgi:hypothetical protein